MAIVTQVIPLDSYPFHEENVALQGQLYTLSFTYNETAQSWYLDIKTASKLSVVEGIRMVPSYPMLLDLALEEYGLTGALYLLPLNPKPENGTTPDPGTTIQNLATYYELKYIYDDGDDDE